MYVLLVSGDVEVCAIGVFSTLKKAKEHAEMMRAPGRRMWIEKFLVDSPSHYEYESEFIVWKS